MKESFFTKRGIYYRTSICRPNAPWIVFVHGLSGSSSAWRRYEEAFSAAYNILSFDLRGHGKSVKPRTYGEYGIQKFSQDLDELLAHLKITNFILVSHSFATFIAFEFLARHQDKVCAAVLLSPGISVGKRPIERLLKPLIAASRILGLLPFSGKPKTHIDYTRYLNTGDWNLRRMYADITNTTLRVYLYATLQSYTADYEALLPEIHIPVLLVHGMDDTIFPVENSRMISKKIPHAKLVLIPGTDHIVVLNNFDEVSQAMNEFISSLPRAAPYPKVSSENGG